MRFVVLIHSEVIYYIHPEIGYLNRASFKLIDHHWSPSLSISYFDRIDYVSTISQEGLIINVVERYLHSYINDYYSAIRTSFYELSRISNHLLAITTHGIDIGSLNCMLLAFEEREKIANLHEYSTGSRIHSSLLYLFGLRWDIPFRFLLITHDLLSTFPFLNRELHSILSSSAIFIVRLLEIGKLDRDTIVRSSLSGIIIRSIGEIIDGRIFGYCVYYAIIFTASIGWKGDCLDRYYIRMNELQQSLGMIADIILFIPFLLSPTSSFTHHSSIYSSTAPTIVHHDHHCAYRLSSSRYNYNHSHSFSNIHKSISYFFIHYLTAHSFYFGGRIYLECPKGIQSVYIHYQPPSLLFRGHHRRDSRIDITNNDFLTIFNIHKYINALFLPDFIALIGSLDFVLGSIDCCSRRYIITSWWILIFYLFFYLLSLSSFFTFILSANKILGVMNYCHCLTENYECGFFPISIFIMNL